MIRFAMGKYIRLSMIGVLLFLSACAAEQGVGSERPVSAGGAPGQTQSVSAKPPTPALLFVETPPVSPIEADIYPHTPQAGSLPFDVIAFGASMNGDPSAFNLAMRSDQSGEARLMALPEEALQALKAALVADPAAVYLVLYAGEMPSSGFSVQIESIIAGQESGADQLVVRYYIQAPDPQSGAATVLTYPYLIVRLRSDMPVESVRFEKAQR